MHRSDQEMTIGEINKIKAFANVCKKTKEKICQVAIPKTYKKGEYIFHEKDQIHSFYAVLSGKVSMSRYSGWGQKRIFFILGEGDLINEVVFDELPVSVVAEVFEDARVLTFKKIDFLAIMKEDFDLTLGIMNSMGKKQRRLYRQLKNTVPIKMDKKLAAKLWKLSRDYGVQQGEWKLIDMNMTVTYLSYMLGSSRETISRAMALLQDAGLVMWEGKKIKIKEQGILSYYRGEENV